MQPREEINLLQITDIKAIYYIAMIILQRIHLPFIASFQNH
jgi:hypothetical protein